MPTTVGALVIDRLEVEETTGIPLTAKPPLLYSFGHLKADENLVIYERIVNKLGHMCLQRLQADSHGAFLIFSLRHPCLLFIIIFCLFFIVHSCLLLIVSLSHCSF